MQLHLHYFVAFLVGIHGRSLVTACALESVGMQPK